jgi:DNA-directed RNA polymerase specialized sigma24 family protein
VEPDVEPSRETPTSAGDAFDVLLTRATSRLRRAFVARYGVELGKEALSDTLVWAWEHREQLGGMDNPIGYLYRVGQTSVRAETRRRRRVMLPPEEPYAAPPDRGPELHTALASLTADQRSAVLLVHAHGYSYADAASTLDIPITTLRNHIHRGMNRLRRHLEP